MSWTEWTCRPARVGEGTKIAQMIAKVQSSVTLPMTIWSSPKAGVHVDDLIAGSDEHLRAMFYVMSNQLDIGGTCSMRWVDENAFCDNVIVSPLLKRMQLGAAMICESFAAYRAQFASPFIAFDVFESERLLHSWYQRMGAREQFRRYWWEIELKDEDSSAGILSGWKEAQPQLNRWGFGRITVQTSLTSYDVGYLPGSFFRVTDQRAASDPGLHNALRRLDGARKLFLVSSSGQQFVPGRRVATSIRMKANFASFIEALRSHVPKRRYE